MNRFEVTVDNYPTQSISSSSDIEVLNEFVSCHNLQMPKCESTNDVSNSEMPISPTLDQYTQTPPKFVAMMSPLAEQSLRSVGEAGEALSPPPSVTTLPIHPTVTSLDLDEAARRFSSLSSPDIIKEICLSHIPQWDQLDPLELEIGQLMFGFSNQLFAVSLRDDCQYHRDLGIQKVLFRIYGKDVRTIYDPSVELRVFKALGNLGIAPKLIAEFQGGRIEEWVEGGALLNKDMGANRVLIAVAAILAHVHSLEMFKHIDPTSHLDENLRRWSKGAMDIYSSVDPNHPSYLDFQRLQLDKLYEESFKLRHYLFPEGVKENDVTRLAFCHNDIQENNIMVTQDSMRLIDYEYSGYNYPAFDIASYFWEMTCDYTYQTYPFFHIDPTKYPSEKKRRLFCAVYLTKVLDSAIKTDQNDKLDEILDSVERFVLANHLLWGFWAVIRAPQAATVTTFDMLYYGQRRFEAYWAQKAKLLAQRKIKP